VVAIMLGVGVAAPAAAQTAAPTPVPDELDRRQQGLARQEPAESLFSLSGIVRGIVQGIASGGSASEHAEGSTYGTGSLELAAVARPSPSMRLFLDVQGLVGRGSEQALGTLSRVNSDADQLEGSERKILVQELWLRFAMAGGRVRLSIGKLDVSHYFDRNIFADDDTTQFLDDALLDDPMLKPPPHGPGATLRFSVDDWRYALGVHGSEDFGGDLSGLPYLIAEVGRRNILAQPGRWQWWVRFDSLPENRDRVTWGSGISIDQFITPTIGVFLRCGLSRSEGEDLTSHALAGGVQIAPSRFERAKDRLGIGYSFQHEPEGSEKIVEAYYTFALAKSLWMTANVQWLVSGPNQVSGGSNRHTVIPGLRVAMVF
jgi:hypothetical protein